MPLLTRPAEFPRWATVPGTDALSGQPNIVQPPGSKMNTGFHYREKPPRNWWNWLQRRNYDWLTFLDEQKQELHADYNYNSVETVPGVTTPGGLVVDVGGPIDVWLNGEKFAQAGATGIVVAATSTNYIYLDSDRVYKSTTSATTASAANRLLIARAVTSGVAVTDLVAVPRKRSHGTHVITVGTGEADFTDLRRAIIHAGVLLAAQGTRVEIVINGALTVGSGIVIDQPVTISGAGFGSSVDWTFTSDAPFRIEAGGQRSRIRNLIFNYTGVTGVSATHAAIRSADVTLIDRVSIEECTFNGCLRGVLASAATVANRWHVGRCEFIQPLVATISGIEMNATGAAADWLIDENDFEGPLATTSAVAIMLDNAIRTGARGNNIDGYDVAIQLSDDCTASVVGQNIIDQARTHGIECDSPAVVIEGNQLRNCGTDAGSQGGSIRVPTTAGLRCVIVGNIIHDWQAGFAISSAAGHCMINDNLCEQVAGTATTPAISGGIAVQDDFCNVKDNYIDLLVLAGAGTGGKVNCYGIKCGLFGAGPAIAFTANGADRCNIQGNIIKNLGGQTAGTGAVGIDVGALSNTRGNMVSNLYGLGIRVEGADGAVHGNEFMDYGFGPLAAPYTFSTAPIGVAPGGDRTSIVGNVGRGLNAASTTCYPIIFESGAVDCFVRHNKIQAGSAAFQFPVNLHLQDYGTWEQTGSTPVPITGFDLAPSLKFPPNSAFAVRAHVSSRESVGPEAGAYEIFTSIATDGSGNITPISTTTPHVNKTGGVAVATTASFAVVGTTDLVVRVNSAPGEGALTWNAKIEVNRQLENYFYI